MSSEAATRVGIVGCGVIAKVYADKLNALPFIDLVACADLEGERATTFAAAHDIPRALSVDALLTDPAVDIVVNLTIPQAHVIVSQAALDAGKSGAGLQTCRGLIDAGAIGEPLGGRVQIKKHAGDDWHDIPLTHGNAQQSRGIGLADMVRAAQRGRPHRASGELALHVLDLMESSIRASEIGAHIDLDTTCTRPEPLAAGLPDDTLDD